MSLEIKSDNSPEAYDASFLQQPNRWAKITTLDLAIASVLNPLLLAGKVRIIDLGCGQGRIPGLLSTTKGYIGVDFSVEALRLARKKNPDINLVQGDMRETPFRDAYFDVVLSVGSHEHLLEVDFSEPRRLLKSDGLFVCALPVSTEDFGWGRSGPQSEWKFTRETWTSLISKDRFSLDSKALKLHPWLFLARPISKSCTGPIHDRGADLLTSPTGRNDGCMSEQERKILLTFIRDSGGQNFLSIGTYNGYSILRIKEQIPFLEIDSVDFIPEEKPDDFLVSPFGGSLTKKGNLRRHESLMGHIKKHKIKGINLFINGSDAFFEQNKKKYGVVFIDGDHGYAQSQRDLRNSLEVVEEGGFILMHDIKDGVGFMPDRSMTCARAFDEYSGVKKLIRTINNLGIIYG